MRTVLPSLDHEHFMRHAVTLAARVSDLPFGALIVDARDRTILAEGWNKAADNSMWHAEIDVLAQLFRAGRPVEPAHLLLYATAEPCPMCQGAVLWSGVGTVVYGTSIRFLRQTGWQQIDIAAEEVVRRSPGWACAVHGVVLEGTCNALFEAAAARRPA